MREKNCVIKRYCFAKLASASAKDGSSYTDDCRSNGLYGLFLWIQYRDHDDGYARFLFFDDNKHISSITTSDGKMRATKNMIDVETRHSEYNFTIDDQDRITQQDREQLLAQAQAYLSAFEKEEEKPM